MNNQKVLSERIAELCKEKKDVLLPVVLPLRGTDYNNHEHHQLHHQESGGIHNHQTL